MVSGTRRMRRLTLDLVLASKAKHILKKKLPCIDRDMLIRRF